MKVAGIGVVFLLSFASNAFGYSVDGVIHTIHANLSSGRVHIYLEGKPEFMKDDGTCKNIWTANFMSDANFKTFVLPILLTAKATHEKIRVGVTGCDFGSPNIEWVDILPREQKSEIDVEYVCEACAERVGKNAASTE